MFIRKVFYSYLAFLLLLSVFPFGSGRSLYIIELNLELRFDYIIHSVLFIPWLFLFVLGIKHSFVIAILLGLIVGVGIEAIQLLLPYRTFNLNDIVANLSGLLIGCIVCIPKVKILLKEVFANY